MARKKVREYTGKRLLKAAMKRLFGLELPIHVAQVKADTNFIELLEQVRSNSLHWILLACCCQGRCPCQVGAYTAVARVYCIASSVSASNTSCNTSKHSAILFYLAACLAEPNEAGGEA